MIIRPADEATALRPHQQRPDTASVYDSTWAERGPTQNPDGLERVMLPNGKIYVVLAVVVIIWIGILALLVRTDRRIDRLERRLDAERSDDPGST